MASANIASNSLTTGAANKKVGELLSTSGEAVESVWDHKILTIDKNPVTVGNILIASVILLLGLIYLSKIKVKLKNFLHRKFSDDRDAANAIENLITYFVLILFITMVLQIANIPLSTFAFVGGALAIGVGLGAQNLINNFISSLIIMVERPVKIGDNIQIDDVQGRVVSIGARCIIIETSKMTDVLIPNSKVIQENLINWSLMDNHTRCFINIRFYKNQLCKLGKELGGTSINPKEYEEISQKIKNVDILPVVSDIQNKIEAIFRSLEQINQSEPSQIYFTGSDNYYFNFQVVFKYDTKKILDLGRLKSDINIILSKNFDIENLVIEYAA